MAGTAHSWTPVDLFAIESEPPKPRITGLYAPGSTTLVSGEPEAGKSWLLLAAAADQLRAGERVLWVDFEMGARQIVRRFEELGVDGEDLTGLLLLAPTEPLRPGSTEAADLEALIAETQPTLVVVDAMTGALELHGLSSNSDIDVERIYRTLIDPLRSHGAAVVVLDHLAKDRETRGKWPIGSQRKVGRADVHLGVEAVTPFARGRDGRVKILVHKDRHGELRKPVAAEARLLSDAETGAVSVELHFTSGSSAFDGGSWWPTGYGERISRALEESAEPLSRNAIESRVVGKAKYVRQAIDGLVQDGYLRPVEARPGAKLVLVKPFRDAEDALQEEAERIAAEYAEEEPS